MRLYAQLVFAVFVLHARAATIPEKFERVLEKDVAPEVLKDPTESVTSEQELIERVDAVKEIDNNIGKSAAVIPVEVVVEDVQPSLKINEVTNDDDIKRIPVDLLNPGPPQRQEHETQNPESNSVEQQIVTKIKNNIQDSQVILKQSFQGVTDGIQNWITNNEQLNVIQNNIKTLSESFTSQIQKLNETLQGFVNPKNPVETVVNESQRKSNADFMKIETRLKILEDNFKNGVQSLSEGVQMAAHLRAEGGNDASSPATTAPVATSSPSPAPALNPFMQSLQQFNGLITSGFQNVTQAINNYVAQAPGLSGIQNIFNNQGSTPAAVLADQPEGTTTQRPYPWQNWQSSLNNFLNPQAQAGQTAPPAPVTPGPIVQAFQNLTAPLLSFIQPNWAQTTQKPTVVTQASSNAVPASPVKPDVVEAQPQAAAQPAAQPEQPASQPNTGPIRQILEKNPVVQGIAGAVQRIQSSITNPEKPRDTAEKSDTLDKGGLLFFPKPGHGHGGGSGDNSSVGAGLNEQNDPKEEKTPEEPKKEKEVEEIKKEQKPEVVADKTE